MRVLAAHARDALKRPIRFIGWGTEEIEALLNTDPELEGFRVSRELAKQLGVASDEG